jgi:hypothetical protein
MLHNTSSSVFILSNVATSTSLTGLNASTFAGVASYKSVSACYLFEKRAGDGWKPTSKLKFSSFFSFFFIFLHLLSVGAPICDLHPFPPLSFCFPLSSFPTFPDLILHHGSPPLSCWTADEATTYLASTPANNVSDTSWYLPPLTLISFFKNARANK